MVGSSDVEGVGRYIYAGAASPVLYFTVLFYCTDSECVIVNMKVLMRADTHQNIQLPVDSGNKPNFTFSQVRS